MRRHLLVVGDNLIARSANKTPFPSWERLFYFHPFAFNSEFFD